MSNSSMTREGPGHGHGALVEAAPAKINLTLKILGRRPDGYHALASLVAFASVGDTLQLAPGGAMRLRVEGPFAAALGPDNLVLRAARVVARARPDWQAGAFRLVKRLPVAAGLGGGSADAAAALRLLARANAGRGAPLDLGRLAAELGADVAVCLLARAAWVWGAGEHARAAPPLPPCAAVLVNPGVALATADVYGALAAPAIAADAGAPEMPGPFADVGALAAHLRAHGNELEPAALRLVPAIADVLAALGAEPGCLTARMSGSGATCFGLFAGAAQAEAAAERIAGARPGWWVAATDLR